MFLTRSVREDCHNAEREAAKEEEDQYQEVYPEPVLQWVVLIWGAVWADTG